MNAKFRMPKLWGERKFTGTLKELVLTIVATTISIILTFGTSAWLSEREAEKARRLLAMTIIHDIDESLQVVRNRKEAEEVAPMIGTFGIVIAGCNVISTFKISPPAKNIAFPVAMALFAILYVIAISIKFVGFKGFWAYLTAPLKFLLPFKVLDFIIKPISLSLRLFGNVFGAFVFMEFLYIVAPIILPGAAGIWFDIADGFLQAIVFSYLTMSYIGEIVEIGHEKAAEEAGKTKTKKKKKVIDDSAVAA